jgi:hypothetical protein
LRLSEMFDGEEGLTFEQQRDEVLSLVEQAADLHGPDVYLRRAVHRCRKADNELEFNEAYESLTDAISSAPLQA